MNREQVRARIEEIGIVPAVRVATPEDARFAAEAVSRGGIPIVEITMTVSGALEVISDLVRHSPEITVGAGTVLDIETARRCLDAGAHFLTNPGFDLEVVEFAVQHDVAVLSGALTPTEVIAAWKAGSDFVKVYPCAQLGGESYIRALKTPLRQVPLIASGGVNQQTAAKFILAGAAAIGIGRELIPRDAIPSRQEERIHELARRLVNSVKEARAQMAATKQTVAQGT